MEAREKKAAFLEYLVSCLKLRDVRVVQTHLTVEEAREWGPRFEAVVSRATYILLRFLEVTAPILLPGVWLWPSKGRTWPGESWKPPPP